MRAVADGVSRYLDAPSDDVWTVTDDVQPENYLLIGGTWHAGRMLEAWRLATGGA